MEIIFKHTWIMFIAVTIANGLVLKFHSKKYIAQNPELKVGYEKYFKGWMFYGNMPWIIMMIGNLSGITNNTFEYFNPKAMNPMVLIFHFSIVVLCILSVRWIYFKNGAEFLEAHPGLFQKSSFSGNANVTAKQIKIFFPIMLLGGIAGMGMMWIIDFPIPQF